MRIDWLIQDVLSYVLSEIEKDPRKAPTFEIVSDPERIWQTLIFCILSSQTRATRALDAAIKLTTQVPYFDCNVSTCQLHEMTLSILNAKGTSHRFPKTRARQIVDSLFSFAQIYGETHEYLSSFDTEFVARLTVSRHFPGLGLKQTSMFLRDIGFSKRLCIIDTHVLWYVRHTQGKYFNSLTPKRYFEVEEAFLKESERFQIEPNVLDAAIWATVKTIKANPCLMLCA